MKAPEGGGITNINHDALFNTYTVCDTFPAPTLNLGATIPLSTTLNVLSIGTT